LFGSGNKRTRGDATGCLIRLLIRSDRRRLFRIDIYQWLEDKLVGFVFIFYLLNFVLLNLVQIWPASTQFRNTNCSILLELYFWLRIDFLLYSYHGIEIFTNENQYFLKGTKNSKN
jgi:hypothetical protein